MPAAIDMLPDFSCLQYVEEPVQDPRDLAAFFGQTHIPMALDETLDEAFSGQGLFKYSSALDPEHRLQQQMAELGRGAVVALVAKPGMIGGFERAMSLSHWAASQGVKVPAQWLCCHTHNIPIDRQPKKAHAFTRSMVVGPSTASEMSLSGILLLLHSGVHGFKCRQADRLCVVHFTRQTAIIDWSLRLSIETWPLHTTSWTRCSCLFA